MSRLAALPVQGGTNMFVFRSQDLLLPASLNEVFNFSCRCKRLCSSNISKQDVKDLRSEFWNLNAASPKENSLQGMQREWIVSTIQKSSDFSDQDEPILHFTIGSQRVCRKFYEKCLPISHGRLTKLLKDAISGNKLNR